MSGDAQEALQDRIATYRRSGDAGVLLEDRALVEVVVLRASQGWPTSGALPPGTDLRRGLDAAVTAGVFLWLRSQELPQADRLDCLLEATELLTAVRDIAPRALPRPVARTLTSMTGQARKSDHASVHDKAIDVLSSDVARSGELSTVDYAITLLSAAIRSAAGDRRQPYYLSDLGTAWLDRFQITGRGRDLENCLDAHERALADPVPVPEDQAGLLANYSGALLAMFEHDGDGEILGHALVAARMATDLARSAAHPRRAKTVAELAKRYAAAPARHRAGGSAVGAGSEAGGGASAGRVSGGGAGAGGAELAAEAEGSAWPDVAVAGTASGPARTSPDRADPDRARPDRAASGRYDPARSGPLLAVPDVGPERGGALRLAQLASLSRLRAALLASNERDDREVDLDEAVQVAREAASLAPAGDPAHLRYEASLAHLLGLQASRRARRDTGRRGAGDHLASIPGPAEPPAAEDAPVVLPWQRSLPDE
jgi:hypothetical protein